MNTMNTATIAIGDLIAGFAMALWVVLMVSPAIAMTVVVVGKKWNDNTRRRYGIELEMILKRRREDGGTHHAVATWLTLKGIESRTDSWSSASSDVDTKVQPDSSVDGNGIELVSHVLYDGSHKKWIKDVMTAMRGLTSSSRSAGYHVHIGLKDLYTNFGDDGQLTHSEAMAVLGRVIWAYGYFERKGFDLMVSISRRDGEGMSVSMRSATYANRQFSLDSIRNGTKRFESWNGETQSYDYEDRPVDAQTKWIEVAEYSSDRYSKINPVSIHKHGTIEFRQHQCINADGVKALNWADLCFDLVNRCVDPASLDDIESHRPTIDGLFDWMGYASTDRLRNYWTARAKLLDGQTLTQGCSTCGSTRCMLDNRCPTDDENRERSSANQDEFGRHARNMTQPRWMSCSGCGNEVRTTELYGVQFDGEYWFADLDGHECNDYWTGDDCTSSQYSMSAIGLGLMLMFPMMSAIALLVGCGIGAIHSVGKKFKAKARFKKLFTSLVSRGGHASGFAFEAGDGVRYLKAAESSIALAPNMNKHIDDSVIWGMCHTRFATHGDRDDGNNAHPHFDSKGIVTLVHNGTIDNWLEAWPKMSVPRTGDVDSMVIAQSLYDGGIEHVVEHIIGSMSLIWSDARDPTGTLKCWTNGGNDLHMGRLDDKTTGRIVIASTLAHLKESFGNRLVNDWAAYVGREYTIHPNGELSRRDIEGSADTYQPFINKSWRDYIPQATKATGQPDSCTISFDDFYNDDGIGIGEYDHIVEMVHDAQDDWGGWPAFDHLEHPSAKHTDRYHGYDALANKGIRPNGTRYNMPQYIDTTGQYASSDIIDIINGRHDPKTQYDYNYIEY